MNGIPASLIFKDFKIDTLWRDALDTIVPSSSTGLKMATGLIKPVLETREL
jgi:hypothetical protein